MATATRAWTRFGASLERMALSCKPAETKIQIEVLNFYYGKFQALHNLRLNMRNGG